MSDFFHWFGVLHAVAYGLAGFLVAFWMFVEWLLKRLKLKRDLIRALARYYQDKIKSERIVG